MWNREIKKSLEFSQRQELSSFLLVTVFWYSTDQDERSFDNICEFQGNWSWLEVLIEPASWTARLQTKYANDLQSSVRLSWFLSLWWEGSSCWQFEIVQSRIGHSCLKTATKRMWSNICAGFFLIIKFFPVVFGSICLGRLGRKAQGLPEKRPNYWYEIFFLV